MPKVLKSFFSDFLLDNSFPIEEIYQKNLFDKLYKECYDELKIFSLTEDRDQLYDKINDTLKEWQITSTTDSSPKIGPDGCCHLINFGSRKGDTCSLEKVAGTNLCKFHQDSKTYEIPDHNIIDAVGLGNNLFLDTARQLLIQETNSEFVVKGVVIDGKLLTTRPLSSEEQQTCKNLGLKY